MESRRVFFVAHIKVADFVGFSAFRWSMIKFRWPASSIRDLLSFPKWRSCLKHPFSKVTNKAAKFGSLGRTWELDICLILWTLDVFFRTWTNPSLPKSPSHTLWGSVFGPPKGRTFGGVGTQPKVFGRLGKYPAFWCLRASKVIPCLMNVGGFFLVHKR